jgi:hypothetical protein
MRLLPQSKKLIEQMKKAGYPLCLSRHDWSGKHARHCNSCIKGYKALKSLSTPSRLS